MYGTCSALFYYTFRIQCSKYKLICHTDHLHNFRHLFCFLRILRLGHLTRDNSEFSLDIIYFDNFSLSEHFVHTGFECRFFSINSDEESSLRIRIRNKFECLTLPSCYNSSVKVLFAASTTSATTALAVGSLPAPLP